MRRKCQLSSQGLTTMRTFYSTMSQQKQIMIVVLVFVPLRLVRSHVCKQVFTTMPTQVHNTRSIKNQKPKSTLFTPLVISVDRLVWNVKPPHLELWARAVMSLKLQLIPATRQICPNGLCLKRQDPRLQQRNSTSIKLMTADLALAVNPLATTAQRRKHTLVPQLVPVYQSKASLLLSSEVLNQWRSSCPNSESQSPDVNYKRARSWAYGRQMRGRPLEIKSEQKTTECRSLS